MNNRDILTKYFTDNNIKNIWGTMYGGKNPETECIISIAKNALELTRDADEFVYIWEYPGPDANLYKFSDYGVTWAFTREELSQYETYEEKHHKKE